MSDDQRASPRIYNPPAQAALSSRITTWADSLRRMRGRLYNYSVPSGARPLQRLTTRDSDDPVLAMCDAWSVVLDVLTFYQERIANEGYLRTATERRSLEELSRSIGYVRRPAVSASTYLAFTLEDAVGSPPRVLIPRGAQVQSVPGPGEQPQTFETTNDLNANVGWNELRPRLSKQQSLAAIPINGAASFDLEGLNSGMRIGDLLSYCAKGQLGQTVRVLDVTLDIARDCTRIRVGAEAALQQLAPTGAGQLTPSSCDRVTVFRQRIACFGFDAPSYASLYGASSPSLPVLASWDDASGRNARTIWQDSAGGSYFAASPAADLYLERVVPEILPGGRVLLVDHCGSREYVIESVIEASVTGYGRMARVTGLVLKLTSAERSALPSLLVRQTAVLVQSQSLPLCSEVPLLPGQTTPVTDRVTLDSVVPDLSPGQLVALSGEEFSNPGVTVAEIATLGVISETDGYTTLSFAPELRRAYLLHSLRLGANVVAATHGQTIADEVLGSGDAGRSNQRFSLSRSPLTYISADNESGATSSISISVNGIAWSEVPSLIGQDGSRPCYMLSEDELGQTSVIFGDGETGARLPSGQDNVIASYRIGSGPEGMVAAGSLQLLLTRPLGVRAVYNPLPATGASSPEQTEAIKKNAPLSLFALRRIVSMSDYEAFAAAFAGIAKARATQLHRSGLPIVHLTIAGEAGAPLSRDSLTFKNLTQALRELGDPTKQFVMDDYVRRSFRIAARLIVDPRYDAESVRAATATALSQAFSFAQRDFGQPVRQSEVIRVIQRVPGVRAVLLGALYYSEDPPALKTELQAATAGMDASGQSQGAELLLLSLSPRTDLGVGP